MKIFTVEKMRVVIQRVSTSSVLINSKESRSINQGMLILLGIEGQDELNDADWLCNKIQSMRIFSDADGKMNLSLNDVSGEIMVISQFTLHASTIKGNRPSFIRSAKPDKAIPLYNYFINKLKSAGINVITGEFGADMKVQLINDGPVTIFMDSKHRE